MRSGPGCVFISAGSSWSGRLTPFFVGWLGCLCQWGFSQVPIPTGLLACCWCLSGWQQASSSCVVLPLLWLGGGFPPLEQGAVHSQRVRVSVRPSVLPLRLTGFSLAYCLLPALSPLVCPHAGVVFSGVILIAVSSVFLAVSFGVPWSLWLLSDAGALAHLELALCGVGAPCVLFGPKWLPAASWVDPFMSCPSFRCSAATLVCLIATGLVSPAAPLVGVV